MNTETNAVIYARYSSHSQTEQSIEGQLHDAYAFAKKSGYHIIGEYIDRALTGKSDERPDFQRLMDDAKKKQFQIVIVWKLDRFSRNRYDSAVYKRHLKKYGVRVVSVMENITDSPEGIILEGLLEAMAEYYSANLAENIRRGQQESRKKGWYCGGSIPWGYRLEDHKLIEDPKTAPLVRELYQRYADGESLASIANDFNSRGYRTARGREFKSSTFDKICPNASYIGEYAYSGIVVPGLTQPLISRELYEKCLERRTRNRRAPAAGRSDVNFILQGKLFCGECGSPMCGDAGTSKSGIRHYYYSCSARKHKRTGCQKKAEKKDYIEWYVCEQTVKYILDPDRLDYIAQAVVDVYNADVSDGKISILEQSVKRLNDELNSLVDKLIITPRELASRVTDRMLQLERQRKDQETELAKLRIQQGIRITKEEVTAWLSTFSQGDLFDESFRVQILDTFVNSIYLYNDKIVIFYNIRDGRQSIGIEEINSLDEKIEKAGQSSTLTSNGGALSDKVEHLPRYIFLRGRIGLVCFR